MPGWESNTIGVGRWEDLPENAKRYVEFIEDYLARSKCKYIGTGVSFPSILEQLCVYLDCGS